MNLKNGELLTIPEAAQLLHVSRSTAYRLADAGELKAFHLGKCRRTSMAACQDLVERKIAEASQRKQ